MLRSRRPGLSPRRSRPQRRRRESRCGLPSRSELRAPLRRHHRRHRAHLGPLRPHGRPTRSHVHRPQLPRRPPAVPRLLHPRLQRPPFVPRRLQLPQVPVLLSSHQAASHPGLPLRPRLHRDPRGRPASAHRTLSSRRIQRSRLSGSLERSFPTWSCTILASARKGFAMAT